MLKVGSVLDDLAAEPPDDYADIIHTNGNGHAKESKLPQRSTLDWPRLEGEEPPVREWALSHWLPRHHASLLAGRGGIGKTLAAQHLGTAMSLGASWVDAVAKPLRVLFWAGEDDANELWRRQIAICAHFRVGLSALDERFYVQSYESVDITLAQQVHGLLMPTPMMAELTQQVRDYAVDYVFLDNIARLYGGNENDRHQVTQFLAWLTAAVSPAGVCLLGHPAKGAGSEYSGSTAWEGAVRARLYLSDRLPDQPIDPDDPPDECVRYLSRRKSNYSANDWRKLELHDGVLVPEAREPESFAPVRQVAGEFAKDIVIRAVRQLHSINLTCSASTRSSEYLPKLATQYKMLDGLPEKRFGAIMRECLKAGDLILGAVGKKSNRTAKTGILLKP